MSKRLTIIMEAARPYRTATFGRGSKNLSAGRQASVSGLIGRGVRRGLVFYAAKAMFGTNSKTYNATNRLNAEQEGMTQMEKFWDEMEFCRYGFGSLLVLWIICMGAITTGFGGFSFTVRLICTINTSMAVLICFLGLLPMKWLFGLSALALLVDIVFIIAGMSGL